MAIDPGAASIVASVLLLIGVIVQSRRSTSKGQREAAETKVEQDEETASAAPVSFAENIALNEYIDAKIEAATRPLKQQIARMARVLPVLREAFRQHIRDVARTWGKSPHPPEISPTIRRMLLDEDLDNTFGDEEIAEYRDDYHSTPPAAG